MDLNNDARLKARQQFKKEHRYIRICKRPVRTIEKQDVARLQLIK